MASSLGRWRRCTFEKKKKNLLFFCPSAILLAPPAVFTSRRSDPASTTAEARQIWSERWNSCQSPELYTRETILYSKCTRISIHESMPCAMGRKSWSLSWILDYHVKVPYWNSNRHVGIIIRNKLVIWKWTWLRASLVQFHDKFGLNKEGRLWKLECYVIELCLRFQFKKCLLFSFENKVC